MDRCFEILEPLMGYNIKEILYPSLKSDRSYRTNINQTEVTQPVIFAFEYALAKLLMAWGIKPRAMIGHSIGEYVAACLAGVFSLPGALEIVACRGRLMQGMPPGAMLSIPITESELMPFLTGNISLAAVNSTSRCVVSGAHEEVDMLEEKLKENGYESTRLHTSHAFHSGMMDPILKEFENKVKQIKPQKPELPYISDLTGYWITEAEAASSEYWASHLRAAVRFSDGLNELLKEKTAVLVEVGPAKSLATFARKHKNKTPQQLVLNLVRHPNENIPDDYFLADRLGTLWLYGIPIDWAEYYSGEQRHRLPLPTYPFDRQRYWIDGDPLKMKHGQGLEAPQLTKKKDISSWFYVPSWERAMPGDSGLSETDAPFNWLIFMENSRLSASLAARLKQYARDMVTVQTGSQFKKLNDHSYIIDPGFGTVQFTQYCPFIGKIGSPR
jgi:acyl transferase domain-containing protein